MPEKVTYLNSIRLKYPTPNVQIACDVVVDGGDKSTIRLKDLSGNWKKDMCGKPMSTGSGRSSRDKSFSCRNGITLDTPSPYLLRSGTRKTA